MIIRRRKSRSKTTLPDGRMIGAVEVDYEFESEPWTTVRLKDGTVLKMRISINKIFRLDQYDPINGEPGYFVQNGLQIKTQVPASLKKRQKSLKPSGQEIV